MAKVQWGKKKPAPPATEPAAPVVEPVVAVPAPEPENTYGHLYAPLKYTIAKEFSAVPVLVLPDGLDGGTKQQRCQHCNAQKYLGAWVQLAGGVHSAMLRVSLNTIPCEVQ